MSIHYDDWVAGLGAATALAGTELIAAVQSNVTVKAMPSQLATYVFNTALPALPDSGAVVDTDKFAMSRAAAGKSVLASAIATYTAAAATNLSTLGPATTFDAADLLLVYDVTATAVGKKITATNFETQVFADFAAYVAGTSPWAGIAEVSAPAGTEKLYLTLAGAPKYMDSLTLVAYAFQIGMGTTASTLQTITAKTTPVAADSILLLDSATTPANEPKVVTLANLLANYLDTSEVDISASQDSGQVNATLLSKKINIIVTSIAHGYVKLPNPTAWPAVQCKVINATDQTITVYGYASETISGTAGATGIELPTGDSGDFFTDGTSWFE